MALFQRSVLGLDLGSHGLKAVELKVSPRSLEAGQCRVHPRAEAGEPLAPELQRFLSMHALPTDQVVCALPAHQLSSRRLEFPFSDKRRLAQAIPFELEGEIPFDLEQILIDWNLLVGDRTRGVVTATLVKRDDVAGFLEQLEATGCDPQVLEAEGLVLANLAPVFGLEGSQLIIDLGHEKTTFCALLNGRPALARSIPVAGRAITEAIAAERGISLAEAEQVKCETRLLGHAGSPASPGALAVVERIAREALRTLEAAEARHGEGPVAREATLTLVGGSARLDRIDELLARRTGLAVERLRMPADSPHAALVEGIDPVLFGPALALALRLSGEPVTRMNFRQGPFAFRQDYGRLFQRELRPTAILAGALLALLTVSTTVTIFLQHRRADRYREAAAQLYIEAFPDQNSPPANPVAALGGELRAAQGRADFLGLYGGNRSALELLAELSRTIPGDLDVRITEVQIDRNLIRLDVEAGGYESVDRLTAVLAGSLPFQSAKVAGSIKTDRQTGGVRFDVSIPLPIAGGEEA